MIDKRTAYLKTQVMTARPEQLTLMLFDGAIRFGEKGRRCLQEQDYEGSFTALSRAEQIVMELMNSLRPQSAPEICRQQAGLYLFVYSKLVDANMSREVAPLSDAMRVLGILRQTWVLLIEKLQKTPDAEGARPAQDSSATAVSIEG